MANLLREVFESDCDENDEENDLDDETVRCVVLVVRRYLTI